MFKLLKFTMKNFRCQLKNKRFPNILDTFKQKYFKTTLTLNMYEMTMGKRITHAKAASPYLRQPIKKLLYNLTNSNSF